MHHYLQRAILGIAVLGIFPAASSKTLRSALIIVDVQDCFLPGGSLAVKNGFTVLPVINSVINDNKFDLVVFSMDWHPSGHVSFASTHNRSVGDIVRLNYQPNGVLCVNGTVTSTRFPKATNCNLRETKHVEQKLWPDHCVQNVSSGPTSSRISSQLKRSKDDVLVYKGTNQETDSYSAFFDNGHFSSTDLNDKLKASNITTVFITGFALDICVFYTSRDAKQLGYDTYIVTDASMGIDPDQVQNAKQNLTQIGVNLITHAMIQDVLKGCSSETLGPYLALILTTLFVSRKLASNWLVE